MWCKLHAINIYSFFDNFIQKIGKIINYEKYIFNYPELPNHNFPIKTLIISIPIRYIQCPTSSKHYLLSIEYCGTYYTVKVLMRPDTENISFYTLSTQKLWFHFVNITLLLSSSYLSELKDSVKWNHSHSMLTLRSMVFIARYISSHVLTKMIFHILY